MKLTDLKFTIAKLLTLGDKQYILLSATDCLDVKISFILNKASIEPYLIINNRSHSLRSISINEWISTDHRIIYNDLKLGILTAIKHMRNDLSQISCDLQEKSKND